MVGSERLPDLVGVGLAVASTTAGAVLAATDSLGTGLVLGSAGILGLMFRYWFSENKRNTEQTWDHVDEYRVERDYYRALADHWQARWLAVVSPVSAPAGSAALPPLPDLDKMKAEARAEKEQESRRGRRK